jgi:hypothetical protein
VRDAIDRGISGQLVGEYEAGAADSDWRMREFFAAHLHARRMRREEADAPRWVAIEQALLADQSKQVRMAAALQLRTAMGREQMRAWRPGSGTDGFADQLRGDLEQMRTLPLAAEVDAWLEQKRDSLDEMERLGGPPPDIADRPLYNDRRWAAHNYVDAAPLLLADPICEVRADAVGQMLAHAPDPILAARARQDPCPRVRAAVIRALGDQVLDHVVTDLASLARDELLATAAATSDPERLAALAAHSDEQVRATVARNHGCPGALLTLLYRDPEWEVWTAAKANPAWPDGNWIGDALVGHGLKQPLDADRVAAAVTWTRSHVRCAAGRSRVYMGAGYLNPRPDAPWLCDRDAVVLHSWGPFCWEHQQEVDQARQSGGSDGYLGQRLRSGLWVRVGQGGPVGPLAELWAGPW